MSARLDDQGNWVRFTSGANGIRVPQDATLEEAASIAADHFLLFAPTDWHDLHAKAKRAGFILVPSARVRA